MPRQLICFINKTPAISKVSRTFITPVTPRQPARQRITNAHDINKRSKGGNTCLGITCQGSVWSVTGCSQTGIYNLFLSVNFHCVRCCKSRWLSRGGHVRHNYSGEPESYSDSHPITLRNMHTMCLAQPCGDSYNIFMRFSLWYLFKQKYLGQVFKASLA